MTAPERWRPAMCPDPTGCAPLIHPTTDPDNMGPGFAERGFAVFCWGRLAEPLVWTFDGVEHVETLSTCQSSPLKGVVRWLENASDWSALNRGYRAAISAAVGPPTIEVDCFEPPQEPESGMSGPTETDVIAALTVAYNDGYNDGKEGLKPRDIVKTTGPLVASLTDDIDTERQARARLARIVEAAVDNIIEAHNVEHGESCDCPIGLNIEEYEAVIRG